MRGTFYIIAGAVGTPHYMPLADLRQLAAAGDEIGGHTVSHFDLANAAPAEVRRQLCEGRQILTRWGFQVTSLAYPDGAYNRGTEAIARGCGYNGARIVGGLSRAAIRAPWPKASPRPTPTRSAPPARWTIRGRWRTSSGW